MANGNGPPAEKFPFDKLPEQALENASSEIIKEAGATTAGAFSGYTSLYGWEPWLFDGATAKMLLDIFTGTGSSNPQYFTPVNDDLVFVAQNEEGWSLFDLDGATGALTSTEISMLPRGMTAMDGLVYFTAYNGVDGSHLYGYDPETDTLSTLSSTWSNAFGATSAGGYIYYVADDGTSGNEVVRYDPVTGDNTLFDLSTSQISGYAGWLTAVGDDVYYRGYDGETGLFKIEPGAQQPVEVGLTVNGITSYGPQNLTAIGNDLYFSADSPELGRELFRIDGDTGSLTQWDVVPGTAHSHPGEITDLAGTIFFNASDGGSGYRLYSIAPDDTIEALTTADGSYPDRPFSFAEYNGDLYFSAYEPETGRELWKVESDTGQMELVLDAAPGPDATLAYPMAEIADVLALAIYDLDAGGYKLATYDGADITYNDDVELINPASFTVVDDALFLA